MDRRGPKSEIPPLAMVKTDYWLLKPDISKEEAVEKKVSKNPTILELPSGVFRNRRGVSQEILPSSCRVRNLGWDLGLVLGSPEVALGAGP